ncbi:testis-specific serine/threonine-protein kinase 6-like [Asterias rubens]|uniref:testis-specific serine/threonine-protein kinase 6-like n=1 Tax=Asterias rubens TaxID=7604 RepID=UPI001455CDC3|nr:testis-specific serine/threonine-protein kinase 6-like [Asterias rubens]
MTFGMSDALNPKTPKAQNIKSGDRPRSALGNAYERLRQLVRPKPKKKQDVPVKTEEAVDRKPKPKTTKAKGSEEPSKTRGLADSWDRQRKVKEDQTTTTVGKPTQQYKTLDGSRACSNSTQRPRRKKHSKRRAYAKADSADSSSSCEGNEHADNEDLWFLSRRGIELEKKLGEGTYAQVHAGHQVKCNRQVAVKIISLAMTNQRYRSKFLPRETDILRKVNHPNIIHLFDTLRYGQKVFFVTELAHRGDLLCYVQKLKVLSSPVARTIFSQIADGIEYLHQNGIYHRDLKCENILLDPGDRVKLTDFGFAREWYEPNNLCRTFCGSAAYASPEILSGVSYEPSTADVWSMGVVLYVMVQGKMPFDDADVKRMLHVVRKYDVTFFSKRPLSAHLKALIQSILNHGQWDRATIGDIKSSRWLMESSVKA